MREPDVEVCVGVQGRLWLWSEFEASLGNVKPCFKQQQIQTQIKKENDWVFWADQLIRWPGEETSFSKIGGPHFLKRDHFSDAGLLDRGEWSWRAGQ